MVSIRRRKLLGPCSGRSSFLAPQPQFAELGKFFKNSLENTESVSNYGLSTNGSYIPKEETTLEDGPGKLNVSASSPSQDNIFQHFPDVKRRKRHRRKQVKNQEPCIMRGVYFKNSKWQAAIKFDKKQIHLGTVGSQEEAARLYDRAAFKCGREPNFELSEEEKQQLRKFKWDEFLAFTRLAITSKKSQRTTPDSQRKLQNNELERAQGHSSRSSVSASDDDTSVP
ncbi:ethylene-responsive transcription factor-like protein At4g13040 [Henckelia pumila]|uniref:ethylene-responsive transcription factor-like protein At4g13040 n=1 Tax=Henckelia pumila TaxID=405737 RepID=UPI003C6E2F8D